MATGLGLYAYPNLGNYTGGAMLGTPDMQFFPQQFGGPNDVFGQRPQFDMFSGWTPNGMALGNGTTSDLNDYGLNPEPSKTSTGLKINIPTHAQNLEADMKLIDKQFPKDEQYSHEERGKLYSDEQKKEAYMQGLLGLAAGLLGSAGWNDKPVSLGQGLSRGIGAGVHQYAGALAAGKEAQKTNAADALSKAHERYYNFAADPNAQAKLHAITSSGSYRAADTMSKLAVAKEQEKTRIWKFAQSQADVAVNNSLKLAAQKGDPLAAILLGAPPTAGVTPQAIEEYKQRYMQERENMVRKLIMSADPSGELFGNQYMMNNSYIPQPAAAYTPAGVGKQPSLVDQGLVTIVK